MTFEQLEADPYSTQKFNYEHKQQWLIYGQGMAQPVIRLQLPNGLHMQKQTTCSSLLEKTHKFMTEREK